jgi:hypothetical protein
VFAGYRLRVAAVLRDYGPAERREQAPADSNAAHAVPCAEAASLER